MARVENFEMKDMTDENIIDNEEEDEDTFIEDEDDETTPLIQQSERRSRYEFSNEPDDHVMTIEEINTPYVERNAFLDDRISVLNSSIDQNKEKMRDIEKYIDENGENVLKGRGKNIVDLIEDPTLLDKNEDLNENERKLIEKVKELEILRNENVDYNVDILSAKNEVRTKMNNSLSDNFKKNGVTITSIMLAIGIIIGSMIAILKKTGKVLSQRLGEVAKQLSKSVGGTLKKIEESIGKSLKNITVREYFIITLIVIIIIGIIYNKYG